MGAPFHLTLWAATAVGASFLEEVRVHALPYHCGGFEGRECHRISERSRLVRDALAPYLSMERMVALRDSWNGRALLSCTFNRA